MLSVFPMHLVVYSAKTLQPLCRKGKNSVRRDKTTIVNQSKHLHKITEKPFYLKSACYPELVITCSCRSMTRCRKPIPLGHYDGGNAEDTYNGEVDKSWLRGTIERVVQPGHEGAHDQEGNARVVKSEERGWQETTAGCLTGRSAGRKKADVSSCFLAHL